ncbi:hypothetical protein BHE74_00013701 [Ensete ventricosum]|nr:hypothetical protein BHE74_00013701 [Ensete ventricosum]
MRAGRLDCRYLYKENHELEESEEQKKNKKNQNESSLLDIKRRDLFPPLDDASSSSLVLPLSPRPTFFPDRPASKSIGACSFRFPSPLPKPRRHFFIRTIFLRSASPAQYTSSKKLVFVCCSRRFFDDFDGSFDETTNVASPAYCSRERGRGLAG